MDDVPTYLLVAISILASFLVCRRAVGWAIPRLRSKGIVAVDIHKSDGRNVANMGGIAILAGYAAGLTLLAAVDLKLLTTILAALATIMLVTMMGMIDDMVDLSQRTKALLPLAASLPLMMVLIQERTILLPLVGNLELGALYPFLLVPIGLAGASNLTNMLAGFNGLEAGMGLIATGSLALAALASGNETGALLIAPMIGALGAFLLKNKYPAKILPGNSGTYAIGAAIACAVMLGDMEVIGVICLIPYVAEFLVKAKSGFTGQCFGMLQPDGTLQSPNPPKSLTHMLMRRGRYTERELVIRFWLIEAFFGALAVVVSYTSLYYRLVHW